MTRWFRACFVITMLVACGGNGKRGADGGMDDGPIPDTPPGMCVAGDTQCSNCIDDDGDGRIDGFDPQCTGAIDRDEATFATGIPGDNIDPVNQDCFFDGNSGEGDDGCGIHVCCLLGAQTQAECPANLGQNTYDPANCPAPLGSGTISQQCIDTCGKLAPPGCDCFGCCTICDPATNQCFDIDIHPEVSPNCTPDALGDPTKCLRCTKNTQCGSPDCGGETCILCPGQDPSDLPATCMGTVCPDGQPACPDGTGCPDQTFCSSGCCIAVIP